VATIEAGRYSAAIWSAAIREAAQVFSAYLTPLGYSLGSHAVRGVQDGETDLSTEVAARLDLGRANRVGELLRRLDAELTVVYRHELVYSQGFVRGKPHIPRYLQMLARGDRRGVPVIIAQRQPTTPENLFVSETVRLSRLVCNAWMSRDSAERRLAIDLADRLARFESSSPWSALRAHPRPALTDLSAIVGGRLISGAVNETGAVAELHRLFSPREPENVIEFEEATEALTFLACNDSRFEDKVFELIVLAWLFQALQSRATAFQIDLRRLKGAGGEPVATATLGDASVEVFFQAAASVLPPGAWRYRHSGAALRAIPDIVIRIRTQGAQDRIVIVDAKNRTSASESEVIYKLLGYRENIRLTPYSAVGVYPSLEPHPRVLRLSDGTSRVTLVHVPLRGGRQVATRLVRALSS